MMALLKNTLKQHSLFGTYLLVFFGLLYGVYMTSGTTYFNSLMIFFVSLVGFYAVFQIRAVHRFTVEKIDMVKWFNFKLNIYWLLIPTLLVVVLHLLSYGGIPALIALKFQYIEEVGMYRNSLFENVPSWIGYPTSIVLQSALPFLLLYALVKKQRLIYWLVLSVGLIYTFGLMQKSFIVGFLLPSMLYALITKKYLFVLKYVGLMVAIVLALSFIHNPPGGSNPALQPGASLATEVETPAPTAQPEASKFKRILVGLSERILVVPGRVVSDWFEAVPAKKPFLYGDGYRIVAKLRGREFHDYPIELYPVIQTEYAARGLTGSVNVASFMYDYANFGNPGMILSGFMLALLLVFLEFFFKDNFKTKIALCIFPILNLSSTSLTTLLFSGGLGFSVLFYFIYLAGKKETI